MIRTEIPVHPQITPRDVAAERAAACMAYDMMAAARPLIPPARSLEAGHPRNYAEVAVGIDARNGSYGTLMRFGATRPDAPGRHARANERAAKKRDDMARNMAAQLPEGCHQVIS